MLGWRRTRKEATANPGALPAVMLLIPISDALKLRKGAWTFPSRVGETASAHGRPCGYCDKAILLFLVLHVVTRLGVTLKCAQAGSGLSMATLCMAIFHLQNVVYASNHELDRMAVCT
jgi:hypothetical protein